MNASISSLFIRALPTAASPPFVSTTMTSSPGLMSGSQSTTNLANALFPLAANSAGSSSIVTLMLGGGSACMRSLAPSSLSVNLPSEALIESACTPSMATVRIFPVL
ncbi:MAG: hypothetical protein A3K67_07260 [Euryarchaeota archaeon RBG_16_62_10]|nr:MAG: hypothetical protein A3K67_07260 [Euryarchaeota archaeon RBG_16_62_10]